MKISIIGNLTLDRISDGRRLDPLVDDEWVGGSVAYISAILCRTLLDRPQIELQLYGNVGRDFDINARFANVYKIPLNCLKGVCQILGHDSTRFSLDYHDSNRNDLCDDDGRTLQVNFNRCADIDIDQIWDAVIFTQQQSIIMLVPVMDELTEQAIRGIISQATTTTMQFLCCDLQGLIRRADLRGASRPGIWIRVEHVHISQRPQYYRDLLSKCRLIKCSLWESRFLSSNHCDCETPEDLQSTRHQKHIIDGMLDHGIWSLSLNDNRNTSRLLLVTRGSGGCDVFLLSGENYEYRFTRYPLPSEWIVDNTTVSEIVDPTGAGDCFLAGFISELSKRMLSPESADFNSIVDFLTDPSTISQCVQSAFWWGRQSVLFPGIPLC